MTIPFILIGPTFTAWRSYEFSVVSLSVRPSVSPWLKSSQDWFISFFLFFCMKLRDHKRRKVTEPDFSGKFSFSQKWAKWPKNSVFGLLRKIESSIFARNYLKCILWLANFLPKSHIWENCHSPDLCAKALNQSDRSIFQITITFELFNRFLYFFA